MHTKGNTRQDQRWEDKPVYFFLFASSSSFCDKQVVIIIRNQEQDDIGTNPCSANLASALVLGLGTQVTEGTVSLEVTFLL